MATGDLTTLALVKLQSSIPDTADDAWLSSAITAVSGAMETAVKRWLAPRGTVTRYLDGALVSDDAASVYIRDGFAALTYLGYASTDQPDDGSGTYTAIPTYYLRGRLGEGWPATRIEVGSGYSLPTSGHNVVKVTGSGGPVAIYPRVQELATIAVVRAFRARSDGSGSPDLAVAGPAGGITILRRIAPAEMNELVRDYAQDTRPAFASVAIG